MAKLAYQFRPLEHLPAKLRRHLRAGKKLNTPRLAYLGIYSAIRAQGFETTHEVQFYSLCYGFGRVTANRIFTAARLSAIRWQDTQQQESPHVGAEG